MKLGKKINGELSVIEIDVADKAKYLAEGYELVVEIDKPSDDAVCSYEHIINGWIQIWTTPSEENE